MNFNDFSHKDLRYYLAYGSNLNLAQMQERCGTSKKVGKAIIKDYRLMFKGSENSNYLTIDVYKRQAVTHALRGILAHNDSAISRRGSSELPRKALCSKLPSSYSICNEYCV